MPLALTTPATRPLGSVGSAVVAQMYPSRRRPCRMPVHRGDHRQQEQDPPALPAEIENDAAREVTHHAQAQGPSARASRCLPCAPRWQPFPTTRRPNASTTHGAYFFRTFQKRFTNAACMLPLHAPLNPGHSDAYLLENTVGSSMHARRTHSATSSTRSSSL